MLCLCLSLTDLQIIRLLSKSPSRARYSAPFYHHQTAPHCEDDSFRSSSNVSVKFDFIIHFKEIQAELSLSVGPCHAATYTHIIFVSLLKEFFLYLKQ